MIKLSTLWLWSLAALFAAFTLPVTAQQQQQPQQQPQAEPAAAPAPSATDQYKAPERTQERASEQVKPQQDSATTQPKKQRQAKGKNTGAQPDTVIR